MPHSRLKDSDEAWIEKGRRRRGARQEGVPLKNKGRRSAVRDALASSGFAPFSVLQPWLGLSRLGLAWHAWPALTWLVYRSAREKKDEAKVVRRVRAEEKGEIAQRRPDAC